MSKNRQIALWQYLCKKLAVLDDNNYTARLIFDRIMRDVK